MMKRVTEIYGRPPRQAAFDGAFRSKLNLKSLKEEVGIKDVAFTKGSGFEITEMVKSPWVYKKLRNFRAGVEAVISFLKRAIGLSRCAWRGATSFKSYVWSSIVSANLLVIARHVSK